MVPHRARLAQQWCSLVLFGFTLGDFLDDSCTRDHHVVELWSGVGSIVHGALQKGLTAVPFDKFRSSGATEVDEDILTRKGFLRAVRHVLRLMVGGLLWMAPVCSSFVFMNSSNCMRSVDNDWKGDVTYKPVIEGNLGAEIACFLWWLAWARGVEVAMENPSRSNFWKYPCIRELGVQAMPHSTLTHRCAWDTVPFGKRWLKQFKFWATGSWIERVARKCSCPGKEHQPLVEVGTNGSVSGISNNLRASGTYPRRLGRAIVDAWHGQFELVGSGVPVHKPAADPGAKTKRRRWQCSSDDSDVPVANHKAADSKKRRSKKHSWARTSSSSDESTHPTRPSSSSHTWLKASSDSD